MIVLSAILNDFTDSCIHGFLSIHLHTHSQCSIARHRVFTYTERLTKDIYVLYSRGPNSPGIPGSLPETDVNLLPPGA